MSLIDPRFIKSVEEPSRPNTPTIIFPRMNESSVGSQPKVELSAYTDYNGVEIGARQVQISESYKFETLVYDRIEDVFGVGDESVRYSFTLPLQQDGTSYLETSTTYYIRGRYRDANGVWSYWSGVTMFNTADDFNSTSGKGIASDIDVDTILEDIYGDD